MRRLKDSLENYIKIYHIVLIALAVKRFALALHLRRSKPASPRGELRHYTALPQLLIRSQKESGVPSVNKYAVTLLDHTGQVGKKVKKIGEVVFVVTGARRGRGSKAAARWYGVLCLC